MSVALRRYDDDSDAFHYGDDEHDESHHEDHEDGHHGMAGVPLDHAEAAHDQGAHAAASHEEGAHDA